MRTVRLDEGHTLSQITEDFCKLWGIKVHILPMSDDVIQTRVITIEGELEFQEYFVHRNCTPIIKGFKFNGADQSKPAPGVLDAIDESDVVIICPSNPWVSIDPILSVPLIKAALENHFVIAVSPILGSKTVKGPAAKMFSELGIQPSSLAVAQHYGSIIDSLAINNSDDGLAHQINELGIHTFITDIMMNDRPGRKRLAQEIIDYMNNRINR
jgi:LPPG:FO 2-phospho-L-lactate transferase